MYSIGRNINLIPLIFFFFFEMIIFFKKTKKLFFLIKIYNIYVQYRPKHNLNLINIFLFFFFFEMIIFFKKTKKLFFFLISLYFFIYISLFIIET